VLARNLRDDSSENTMPGDSQAEVEQTYAWNWFSYHASQRLTAFNFFLVLLGAVLVGYVQAATNDLPALGVVLGGFGVIVSLAFWAIDVRNAELVACGRAALDKLEGSLSIDIRAEDQSRSRLGEVIQGPLETRVYKVLTASKKHGRSTLRLYTHTLRLRNIIVLAGVLSAVAAFWAADDFRGTAKAAAPIATAHAAAARRGTGG
jgi:hypothetical protein